MSILLFKVLSITTPFGRSSRVENAAKFFESTVVPGTCTLYKYEFSNEKITTVQVLVQCTCTRTCGSGLPNTPCYAVVLL